MGLHHVANRYLQMTHAQCQLIQKAGYVLGALLLLGALLWIGLAEDKALAILLAIAALIAARVLYINVPELLAEHCQDSQEGQEGSESPD